MNIATWVLVVALLLSVLGGPCSFVVFLAGANDPEGGSEYGWAGILGMLASLIVGGYSTFTLIYRAFH